MKMFDAAKGMASKAVAGAAGVAETASKGLSMAGTVSRPMIACSSCGHQNPDTFLLFRSCSACGNALAGKEVQQHEMAKQVLILPQDVQRGWKSFKLPDGRVFGVKLPPDATPGTGLLVAVPAKKDTTDHVVSGLRVMQVMSAIADLDYWGEDPAADELADPDDWARIVSAFQGKGQGKGGKGLGTAAMGTAWPQMPPAQMLPGQAPGPIGSMGHMPRPGQTYASLPGMGLGYGDTGAPEAPLGNQMPDLPPHRSKQQS